MNQFMYCKTLNVRGIEFCDFKRLTYWRILILAFSLNLHSIIIAAALAPSV